VTAAQLAQLSATARIDLASYRESHVTERVRRALVREAVADVGDLVKVLRRDEEARTRFRRSVAVSVSGLFRDPAQFELLEREVLPGLAAAGRRISVWSAGCADGSELHSVALLLERRGLLERSFLLGTDLLEENLALARRGVYDGVAVSERIRERLRWEQRDLVGPETPPGAFRLVLCRNMAIYLAPAAKQVLHRRLASVLAHDGVLLLGRSERLVGPRSLELVQVGPHAYRKAA
jgi:chemotaxis protein methyltransferase CheR